MPLRQLGTPRDVAETAFFLSSHSAAKHITGQTITLAGGMEGRVLWQKDDIDEKVVRERIKNNIVN
jgi:3-oxoacyl-[acyl-carrier protein] reductase